MQGAARREHVAQRAQAGVGIGQMVQHAGADDVLEGLPEFGGALDGELAHLEVVERVLALQLLRERDALRADVDADDSSARPAQRVVRRLRRAAAGDQDAAVFAVGLGRPEEMRFGAPARVVPGAAVRVEIVDGRRVGMRFVKSAHPRGDAGVGRREISSSFINV